MHKTIRIMRKNKSWNRGFAKKYFLVQFCNFYRDWKRNLHGKNLVGGFLLREFAIDVLRLSSEIQLKKSLQMKSKNLLDDEWEEVVFFANLAASKQRTQISDCHNSKNFSFSVKKKKKKKKTPVEFLQEFIYFFYIRRLTRVVHA